MSVRASCTTFVHPSICSSVPILLLLLLLLLLSITPSPVQPDLLQLSQLIHLSHLIHPIHPIRLIHPNRFEKLQVRENALLSALEKFTQFILSDHPGPSIQCAWKKRRICRHFLFSRVISAETSAICRYLLKFSFVFVQISAVFCHFLRKSALETKSGWHRGSQEPLFLRPCDHRS